MTSTSEASRSHYLENASRSLLVSSPAISAHLQSVRRVAVEEEKVKPLPQESHWSCTACGSILLPGRSYKSIIEPHLKRTRKDRLALRKNGIKATKLQCSKCNAVSIVEAMKPERTRMIKLAPPRLTDAVRGNTPSDRTPAASPQAPIIDRGPKKRARGKKSSLQSMLVNQGKGVTSNSTGFGLDLMDLMKS